MSVNRKIFYERKSEMKIVHLCLGAFFPDNYSYQENMLPKFHKKQGYDVEVIASLETFDNDGKTCYYSEAKRYTNENDVLVTRLNYKSPDKIYKKLKRFSELSQALEMAKPDILFIHNVQFLDMDKVVSYLKRNKKVKVFCDNHADFTNSAKGFVSRKILHGIIWKHCAKSIEPYTTKFYGVLPARVDFLKEVYGLPEEKCELLVMGADDDRVSQASDPAVREAVRKRYKINDDEILLVTGGKIDHNKTQTLTLMDAINKLDNPKIKLTVFGSVVPELKEKFNSLLSDNVIYSGWKKSDDIYDEFAAADIVVFPGLHSVLWEQAVAMGKPCIFKRISGFTHIDIGGNCLFFENDSEGEYIKKIKLSIEKLDEIKYAAETHGKENFSYNNIAKRSVEAE